MGRRPLLWCPKTFTNLPCRWLAICGISSSFPELSPAIGYVTYVLLTRSPLSHMARRPTAFDLHVLNPPLAFALSQDQTLQFEILTLLFQVWHHFPNAARKQRLVSQSHWYQTRLN